LNGSDQIFLKKSWIKDPWLKQRYKDHKSEIKPWVDSANSSHIWVGKITANLETGLHKLTIQAQDEFGQIIYDYLCLEVLPHHQANLIKI
jgi:hypothetical protein